MWSKKTKCDSQHGFSWPPSAHTCYATSSQRLWQLATCVSRPLAHGQGCEGKARSDGVWHCQSRHDRGALSLLCQQLGLSSLFQSVEPRTTKNTGLLGVREAHARAGRPHPGPERFCKAAMADGKRPHAIELAGYLVCNKMVTSFCQLYMHLLRPPVTAQSQLLLLCRRTPAGSIILQWPSAARRCT